MSLILQAFFSRFAIGVLGANVSFRIHPALSGAIVGLLISLPDAFAMKSYLGIPGDWPVIRRADGMGCDDVGPVTSVPTDPLATGTVIEPVPIRKNLDSSLTRFARESSAGPKRN